METEQNTNTDAPADAWAIVEIYGHRRLAGRVREVECFGAKMLAIDIPDDKGGFKLTQRYGGGSIFSMTPTDEATARRIARACYVDLPYLPPPADDDDDTVEIETPGDPDDPDTSTAFERGDDPREGA